jgi:uncharacterized protein YllA (UPF0747 family)
LERPSIVDPVQLLPPDQVHPITGQPVFARYPFAQALAKGHPEALQFFEFPAGQSQLSPNDLLSEFLWTSEELEELLEFNESVGNTAGAGLVSLLTNPRARTVVTGQQPNLLAAPLYNTAKARGVVRAAQTLAQDLGHPVVPIFWVASDDSDFDELRRFELLDSMGRSHALGRLVSRGAGRRPGSPASEWVIEPADRVRLLSAAAQVLEGQPGSHHALDYMARVLEPFQNGLGPVGGVPFEVQFVRALLPTLSPDAGPILFVTPRMAGLRRANALVAARDVLLARDVATGIAQVAQRFVQQGWTVPLQRPEDALNFFWHSNGIRHPLRLNTDGTIHALVPGSGKRSVHSWSRDALLAHLQTSPGDFSPGVVTRPVVQDLAFRPLAYLGGPGEVAYLAQIHGPSGLYGVRRAPVRLRPAIVPTRLVERAKSAAGEEPAVLSPAQRVLSELVLLRDETLDALEKLSAPSGDGPVPGALPPKAVQKTLWSVRKSFDRLLDRQIRTHGLAIQLSNHPHLRSLVQPILDPWIDERSINWVHVLAQQA